MKYQLATDYIKGHLKNLIQQFPSIRIRYQYDWAAVVHCIEIVPKKIHKSNTDYIKWEDDFCLKFIEKFPDQNIYFFTSDSLVGIEELHFELLGPKYLNQETSKILNQI